MDNPELGMLSIKQIEAEPDLFDMNFWGMRTACGTVACLAGHVMLAAGYTFSVNDIFCRPDGTLVYSEGTEAAKLLGMQEDEEELLFRNEKTLLSIWSERRTNDEALALFREMVEKSMTR